ncbi:MAG: Cna B-type domain-containing protein [Candidatus Limivicinus sp.]|nr:Cna B-type domain-containing protein [Candidatus Limivicinus sp.]
MYNNHAGTAGDDIYNIGTVSFGNVGTDWALDGEPDCNGAIHAIDGWYEDGGGSRWLADTADTSKQHVVLMNAGTYAEAVALKAAHGLIPVVPVDPVPGTDWAVSRSKTATNLDASFESRVTLSLPSAEEQLVTDIVFVLDKSTSPALEQQTLDTLQALKAQIGNTNAQVKVGVVIFNKVANMTGFMDLATQYEAIETAIRQEISSGTNTHAGLLAGIGMLDNDSSVDASRKYLIFVSDGITYMYNQAPTATAWSFLNDGVVSNWAGPDNWKSKYGSNNPPADWAEFLGKVKTQAEVQGTTYEYPYGGTPTASTPVANQSGYVNSVDKALYLTYEAYSAAAAKYHCYAMAAGTKSGEQYLWGPSFMSFLANGKTVDFSQIRNDILYLVDSDSRVEDYMGYVADDYDFDFVKPEEMTLKVGSESYAAVKLSENEYGFKPVNGSYAFRVEYVRGNGHEEEHFVWYINEAISNFAPVQLTYTVRLTNPKAEPGTYGEYDRDGSTDSTELYTNKSAVLYPVDSNGKEGEALPFPKPTVSYTVEPKKLEVSVTKVWDDCNDNDGYRPDSVTVSLLADGEPTGKTLVLSEANQWTGSFTGLDAYADGEEIVYTVTENAVSKYTTVITNGQDSATDFIITNSHVPETTSIPVVKRWNDNNDANDRRPGSITVYLYANGEATGEKLRITARNGWVGEFENLPVYANGKAIDYSIREKSMYFYSGAVSSNPNGGFIITNTYTTSPGTGDSGNIGLWIALASVSLIAMGASLVMVKKKETGK